MRVRITTSDLEWIKRRGADPVVCGTDIQDVVYFTADIDVPEIEHFTFAGCDMVRFDLGKDAPRDNSRLAMYPAAKCLVSA